MTYFIFQLKQQAKAYFGEKSDRLRAVTDLVNERKRTKSVEPLKKEVRELKQELKEKTNELEATRDVIKGNPELHDAFNREVHRTNHERSQRVSKKHKSTSKNTSR